MCIGKTKFDVGERNRSEHSCDIVITILVLIILVFSDTSAASTSKHKFSKASASKHSNVVVFLLLAINDRSHCLSLDCMLRHN